MTACHVETLRRAKGTVKRRPQRHCASERRRRRCIFIVDPLWRRCRSTHGLLSFFLFLLRLSLLAFSFVASCDLVFAFSDDRRVYVLVLCALHELRMTSRAVSATGGFERKNFRGTEAGAEGAEHSAPLGNRLGRHPGAAHSRSLPKIRQSRSTRQEAQCTTESIEAGRIMFADKDHATDLKTKTNGLSCWGCETNRQVTISPCGN